VQWRAQASGKLSDVTGLSTWSDWLWRRLWPSSCRRAGQIFECHASDDVARFFRFSLRHTLRVSKFDDVRALPVFGGWGTFKRDRHSLFLVSTLTGSRRACGDHHREKGPERCCLSVCSLSLVFKGGLRERGLLRRLNCGRDRSMTDLRAAVETASR